MLLTLEALNAEEGDCLLLHCGTKAEPHHVLIDGGPRATFANTLMPRLRELRELHALDDAESLPIALAVLSHIDADHIDGLVAMFEELRAVEERNQPPPFQIQGLWYNGFDDVVGNREVASIESLAASASASPAVRAFIAGTKMGQALRDVTRRLGIPVNPGFQGLALGRKQGRKQEERIFVMRTADKAPRIASGDLSLGGLTLTVLSPMAKELEDFEKSWDTYLKQQAKKKGKGGAAAVGVDRSPTNLSSITLLAEAGGKRLLLTGDARASQILDGLRVAGALADDKPCVVDVFKLPHHGSERNSTPELYQRVHAKHYVICANGKHGNPDRPVLDMIWKARGKGTWQLWTTFPKNAYKLIDPAAARTATERETLEERREALEEVQAWFDAHAVKVNYRDPRKLAIRIDLGDEKLA